MGRARRRAREAVEALCALVQTGNSPLPVKVGELKVVWRATGEGDLTVRYWSPDGRPGELVFGPEAHGGSGYDRPGQEWGTGFNFDEPGCWHIHLERATGSGDAWIEVVAD